MKPYIFYDTPHHLTGQLHVSKRLQEGREAPRAGSVQVGLHTATESHVPLIVYFMCTDEEAAEQGEPGEGGATAGERRVNWGDERAPGEGRLQQGSGGESRTI